MHDDAIRIPWISAAWPIDWHATFGRPAPLALEIGFGNGAFLLALAERRPELDCIGIERAPSFVARVERKAAAQRLANIRVMDGDAPYLLRNLFPAHGLEEVHINFPDPWYKNAHTDRRLLQPEFLRLLAKRIRPGGLLTAATDHPTMAELLIRVFGDQPNFVSEFPTLYRNTAPERVARTHYEAKAMAAGSEIRYFSLRLAHALPDDTVAERVDTVPNVAFQGKFDADAFFKTFQPEASRRNIGETLVVVNYHRAFVAVADPEWLIETTVCEGRLQQNFALVVAARPDERWTVKTSKLGNPRPTAAVKEAVRQLAAAILKASPTLTVVESTVGDLRSP